MSAAELWVAVAFGLFTFALVAACAAVWMVLLSRWVEREYRRDLDREQDRELAYERERKRRLARELETERALAATLAEWRKQKDHG